MKLISLNTWGGKVFAPLMKFIQDNSSNTDIFCFQEVYESNTTQVLFDNSRANLIDELAKNLKTYEYLYCPMVDESDLRPQYQIANLDLKIGLAIFWKKDLQIKHQKCNFIFKDKLKKMSIFSSFTVILQHLVFDYQGKQFNIINTHGFASPGNKLDTDDRIKQSQAIIDLLNNLDGETILVGDFNLMPQTKSIHIIENHMKNLISKFKIDRTRSKLNPYYNKPNDQKFADYTFVSKGIEVSSFEVPNIEISDHLPMILEFS